METKTEKMDAWKAKYPRHWWALEQMGSSDFRDSLLSQLVESGSLSNKQMLILWEKADHYEQVNLGEKILPKKGMAFDQRCSILKTGMATDMMNNPVFRVDFTCENGWRGRFDTKNEVLSQAIEDRSTPNARIKGTIVWAREDFLILRDNQIDVTLG